MQYKKFYISDSIKTSVGQKRVFFIAFLATMAIFLAIAEHMIPKPLPWMRIGLANAITLYAFTIIKKREVFLIVLSRVVATSLLIGSFMSLGFLLSISGAVSSFILMSILYSYCRKVFSLVGISILGAVTSNLVQLLLVNAVFVRSSISYYFIPMVLLLALAGGILSGLFGRFLSENL
ncbi:MAG: Gx transporter family protein [Spirochaetota bacterium]|nr:MAG: Gx transporter family protein [Spirochaetota bacterium]